MIGLLLGLWWGYVIGLATQDFLLMIFILKLNWDDEAHKVSGGAVTAVTNCCSNCVEPCRPHQWGPDLPFLGKPVMRT